MLESSDKYIKLCENLISDLDQLIPTGHALYNEFNELKKEFNETIKTDSPEMIKISHIHSKLCELKKKLVPENQKIVEIVEVEKYRDCGDLEQQNANLLQIIDNLNRKLDETYEMFSEMSNLTDIQKNEVGALKEEIEKLRKELKELNELNVRDILINKKLGEIIEDIKKESKKLSDEVQNQKDNYGILKNGYSINIKKLTDDLTKAMEIIADLNAKNRDLVGQLANLTEMNNKIRDSKLELEKKYNEIKTKESENDTKIYNLEKKLKEINENFNSSSSDEKDAQNKNLLYQVNSLKVTLKKNEQNLHNLKDQYAEVISTYTNEINKLRKEKDQQGKDWGADYVELDNLKIVHKELYDKSKLWDTQLQQKIETIKEQQKKLSLLENQIKSTQIISVLFKNIMFIYDELNYFDEFSRIKPNNMIDNYKSTPKEIKQVDASKLSNNIVVLYNTYAGYFTNTELSFIILFFKYINKLLLRKTGILNNIITGTSVKIDLEYKKVVSAFSSTLLFIYKSIIHRNLYKDSNENKEILERIANFNYHLSNYLKISGQATNRNTSHDKVIDGTLSHDKAHATSLDGKMIMTSLSNERKRYFANLPTKLKELYDIGLQTRPNTPLNFHSPKNSQISSSSEGIDPKHDGSYSDSPKSSISSGEFKPIGRNGQYNYNAHPKLSPEPEDNSSDKSDDGLEILNASELQQFVDNDSVSNNNHMDLSHRQSEELNNMNYTQTPPPSRLPPNTNFLNEENYGKTPYSILPGEGRPINSNIKSTVPKGIVQSIKNIFKNINTNRKNGNNNGSSSNQTGSNSNTTTTDLSSQQNISFKEQKITPSGVPDPTVFESEDTYEYNLMSESSDNKKSEYFGGGVLGGCVMLLNNAVAVLMIMCVLLIMYIIYLYYTNYNTQNNKPQNNYNPYDIMY